MYPNSRGHGDLASQCKVITILQKQEPILAAVLILLLFFNAGLPARIITFPASPFSHKSMSRYTPYAPGLLWMPARLFEQERTIELINNLLSPVSAVYLCLWQPVPMAKRCNQIRRFRRILEFLSGMADQYE